MDFDSAIQLTGYGKFHYELFCVCAFSIISVGFQTGFSPYIFPAAQCELNLTSFQLGFLNVSFMTGGAVSSFIFGFLADFKGRRKVLSLVHLTNAAITIICIFINSISLLIICRFCNGFLIGAPGSIVYTYLSEFQPPKYKSSVICYSGICFTLSWLILPLLAWLILPYDIHLNFFSIFLISSWRIYIIIVIIPEIIAGFWFLKMPESPKYFLVKGNSKEALEIMKYIFSKNTGQAPYNFPVKALLSQNKTSNGCSLQCSGKTMRVFLGMYRQIKCLFTTPMVFLTLLTTTIMFTNMFGCFGLGWWLPELFTRFQRFQALYPNQTITVKEVAHFYQLENNNCEPNLDISVLQTTIAMSITSLVLNVVSGWCAPRVCLKTIPFVSMLFGGCAALSIYWLKSSIENLIVASLFQATIVAANMSIGCVVVELFPANVGAMAMSLTMCAGRLGAMASNLIFGLFIDQHCEIPIFVVAITVLFGAGLCIAIPAKKQCDELSQNKIANVAVISLCETKL